MGNGVSGLAMRQVIIDQNQVNRSLRDDVERRLMVVRGNGFTAKYLQHPHAYAEVRDLVINTEYRRFLRHKHLALPAPQTTVAEASSLDDVQYDAEGND
jgi:hypothetical protein